jgi:hypothetical protein
MTRRILEIDSGVAAGYATQVLTTVGWSVTKVILGGINSLSGMESRWGGGTGGASAFLDKNKRIVDSNKFDILLNSQDFDVVIGDFSERNLQQFELPASVFNSLPVGCSVISLTSFGLDQPLSNRPHADLILQLTALPHRGTSSSTSTVASLYGRNERWPCCLERSYCSSASSSP